MKYKIYTLGCKVNQYDSCMLSRKLSLNGFREASKDTDIIIVNTCAVTKIAIEKCKKIFAIARKENPKAKSVIMGCCSKIYKENLTDLNYDMLWGVGEFDELLEKIKKLTDFEQKKSNSLSKKEDSQIPQLKSRYFIKIQDGCEQLCSYCIVPYTRGKLKSRSALEVVEEVEKSVKNGYREIVLSGIHLGLYGAEISSMRLSELIKMLLRVIADSRIRLSSIEISEVNDDNIKETYRLLKTLKFSKIHVFPFSAHKLTPASKMKNQIGGDIKKKRAKILRDLSVKQEKEFKNNFRGQILDLVVENNGEDKFLGKSEYYFNVLFSKNQIYGMER